MPQSNECSKWAIIWPVFLEYDLRLWNYARLLSLILLVMIVFDCKKWWVISILIFRLNNILYVWKILQ
jgi:hypothetical protein